MGINARLNFCPTYQAKGEAPEGFSFLFAYDVAVCRLGTAN